MSTTRSRTTGSPARGSNRTSLRPGSSGVWQARMARPSMRSVQVPHIATRHEYLKPMDGSCSRWIARRRSRTIIGSILSTRKVLSAPGSLREIVTRTFEEGLGSVKAGSSLVPGSDQPVSFQVVEDELFLRGGNLVYQADLLHELRELDETVRLGSVGYPFLCNEPPELLRRGLAPRFFREDLGRPVWIVLYELRCLLDVAVERLHCLRIVVVVVLATNTLMNVCGPNRSKLLRMGRAPSSCS